MENFTASIHNLFNHRPANHQPDTAAWVGNIRQLREEPPAVAQIDDAMRELKALALVGKLVEVRITTGTNDGKVGQTIIHA